MNNAELAKRQEGVTNEMFVIQRGPEGFLVYAAQEPRNRYIVSGSPDAPQCSCPDFQYHLNDPGWHCKHVLAVLNEFSDIEVVPQNGDTYGVEERRAIQEESQPASPRKADHGNWSGANGNGAVLTLKRSVSPDGRIDALSVEFSSPVNPQIPDAIVERARDILGVQTAIVSGFRKEQTQNGNNHTQNGQPKVPASASESSAAVPARVLGVAGMDGKWGRRLFLTIESEGKILRLFGNAKDLAENLASVGFTGGAQHVAEGLSLNLPCRITTKPSPDGRFKNIDQLLPAVRPQAVTRAWR